MLDIAGAVIRHLGRRAAVATVVAVQGSAPHPVGTSMLVGEDGSVLGSVSGGCVEGAVLQLAEQVLTEGRPVRTRFGISDELAYGVGLTCGGEIDVLVAPAPVDPSSIAQLHAASAGGRAGIAVVAGGPPDLLGLSVPVGGPGGAAPPPGAAVLTDARLAAAGLGTVPARRVVAAARAEIDAGRTGLVTVDCGDLALEVFCETSAPPARLIVCGANEYAVALSEAGAWLGYRVTVCDARPAFASPERFPAATEVVVGWPHDYLAGQELDERTVVCVLAHDPKFEVPLLAHVLPLPVAYVGAMGSRRTHADRVRALRSAGVDEDALARLHSPVGLDLGASSPRETALSILAEVLAHRTGSGGRPLRDLDGPVHRPVTARVAPAASPATRNTPSTMPR